MVARNSAVAPCLRIIIGKLANSSYIMGGGTLLEYAAVGVAAPHLQTFVVSLVPPPKMLPPKREKLPSSQDNI